MKSTGLFGKNSGRVGGVVYSNYRGEQIVRAYQPKVSNPNTADQISQRAKFKLVSQVGATLAKELNVSYVSRVRRQSPRNAWMKEMLKKTVYSNGKASLPIEDIVVTNSNLSGIVSIESQLEDAISGTVATEFNNANGGRVRCVILAYNDGGEIVVYQTLEEQVSAFAPTFSFSGMTLSRNYSNYRAILYAYKPNDTAGASYEDYAVLDEEATLADIKKVYAGNLLFSESMNLAIQRNV